MSVAVFGTAGSLRIPSLQAFRPSRMPYMETTRFGWIVASALFFIALVLRFYKINHPDQVVYVSLFDLLSHRIPGRGELRGRGFLAASTRFILASSPRTTSSASTTSTCIHPSPNSSSVWSAGLLDSMANSILPASATAIQSIKFPTLACARSPRCWVPSPSPLSSGS